MMGLNIEWRGGGSHDAYTTCVARLYCDVSVGLRNQVRPMINSSDNADLFPLSEMDPWLASIFSRVCVWIIKWIIGVHLHLHALHGLPRWNALTDGSGVIMGVP